MHLQLRFIQCAFQVVGQFANCLPELETTEPVDSKDADDLDHECKELNDLQDLQYFPIALLVQIEAGSANLEKAYNEYHHCHALEVQQRLMKPDKVKSYQRGNQSQRRDDYDHNRCCNTEHTPFFGHFTFAHFLN